METPSCAEPAPSCAEPADAPSSAGPAVFMCTYCDVETQQAIAERLTRTLAVISSMRKMSLEDAEQTLCNKLLPPQPPKATKKAAAAAPSLQTLHEALAQAESVKAKGLAMFSSKEELERRVSTSEKEIRRLPHVRLQKFAADLMSSYDPNREYHCGACVGGGDDMSPGATASASERHRLACIFRPLACRNEGCVAMYSARAEAVHDSECPYKLLPCIRGCEMQIQRKAMTAHADGPCPNKPVDCPFRGLGCTTPCTQGGLERHLSEACPAHLSLALGALSQQQVSIQKLQAAGAAAIGAVDELASLRARVIALEGGTEDLRKTVKQSEADLREALKVDLKKEIAQSASASQKEQRRLDEALGKLSRAHAASEKESRGAVGKLGAAHDQLVQTVDAVARRLAAVADGR